MPAPTQSPISPALRLAKFTLIVLVVVVVLQLVLNPAHRRPYVACWPVYMGCKFFSVTVVRQLFPGEHAFALENLRRCERAHASCVSVTSKIPGFHSGDNGLLERLKEQGAALKGRAAPTTDNSGDEDE